MKVTLLGHHDIASLYAMKRVMHGAPQHHYSVFLSGPGLPTVAGPAALHQLAKTDHKLCERFLQSEQASPLLVSAPSLQDPNSDTGLACLHSTGADLILSIRYRHILRGAAIAVPRLGVLNLHSGILPDYRGVMATFWAMLADAAEIGCTLHRITDSGVDSGPVLSISRQPARLDCSYLANVLGLYAGGCDATLSAIESLANGTEPHSREQLKTSGAYYSTPTAADLDRFHAKGLRLTADDDFGCLNLPATNS